MTHPHCLTCGRIGKIGYFSGGSLHSRISDPKLKVCSACRDALQWQDFEGCVRCGARNCLLGDCGKLAEFKSVETLVSYVEPYASLMQFAKIEQRAWAQKAFADLTLDLLAKRLEEFISKHKITECHLVPLSVWRVFGLQWHTSQIFMAAFEAMQKQSKNQPPELQCSYSFSVFKSSSRSSEARRARQSLKKGESMKPTPKHEVEGGPFFEGAEANRILILDDVLSSGSTALDFANLLQQKKLKRFEQHLASPSEYFLFTLMRSPMKSANSI